MNSSKLTTKGRVTIPKPVRDYLGLRPGDKVRFEYEGGGAIRIVAQDVSTHAGTKRHRDFLDEAARADAAMQESGLGYAMPDVHAYVEATVRAEPVKRPRPVKRRR